MVVCTVPPEHVPRHSKAAKGYAPVGVPNPLRQKQQQVLAGGFPELKCLPCVYHLNQSNPLAQDKTMAFFDVTCNLGRAILIEPMALVALNWARSWFHLQDIVPYCHGQTRDLKWRSAMWFGHIWTPYAKQIKTIQQTCKNYRITNWKVYKNI